MRTHLSTATAMLRFAANLTFLWTELPFLDRFAAAAAAGFRGVEFHFPYAFDPAEIKARLIEFQLRPVLHNIAIGDAAAGEFGLACLPGREQAFRELAQQALDYAIAIGTPKVNCLAGCLPAGVSRQEADATLIANLKFAGEAFARHGLTLTVEPLNNINTPRFFLTSSAQTLAILDAVALPNVMLQYDLYHMHLMEGNLASTIARLGQRIGHIQFADAPDRHEPGTGSINFAEAFAAIDASGYVGWVAAEYRPRGSTADSLSWWQAAARNVSGDFSGGA
jgi:hydroxypyruvate isomerase